MLNQSASDGIEFTAITGRVIEYDQRWAIRRDAAHQIDQGCEVPGYHTREGVTFNTKLAETKR